MQKCFPSIFPWLLKWIYIAQVLILVDPFSIHIQAIELLCMNVCKGWKGKNPQSHMGNTSCWKCFYRYLIKGRKSLAAFQATSCKVGHKTSCNFQNHVVFFPEYVDVLKKKLSFLIFAPYATLCPSFCMTSWLKSCLVPSETFKEKNSNKKYLKSLFIVWSGWKTR